MQQLIEMYIIDFLILCMYKCFMFVYKIFVSTRVVFDRARELEKYF